MEPQQANTPSSVFAEEDIKLPDRSTSAPPVLSLQAQSLFAFKAAEHLHLFSDIRCEENYYEFYQRYQDQGKHLPAPLETQPFIVEPRGIAPVSEPYRRPPPPQEPQPRITIATPTRSNSNPPPYSNGRVAPHAPPPEDTGSSGNDGIWTPLPRKMANMVLEDYDERPPPPRHDGRHYQNYQQNAHHGPPHHQYGNHQEYQPRHQQNYQDRHHHQQHQPVHHQNHGYHQNNMQQRSHQQQQHHHQPQQQQHHQPHNQHQQFSQYQNQNQQEYHQPQPHSNVPMPHYPQQGHQQRGYYPQEYDSGYPAPNHDAIQSLWNDNQGGHRQNQYRGNGIAAPTPTRNPPGQTSLMSLLNGGSSKMDPNEDEMISKVISKPKKSSPPMPIAPPGLHQQDSKKVVRPITRPNGVTEIQFPTLAPLKQALAQQESDDEAAARQYTSIEQVIGHIYSLCKDQHGCRFLQKKLEEKDPEVVTTIFNEVYDHMVELMTDPFGNYLCQKLLEFCNDQQRLTIIERVGMDLVKISKNMHGTRAVQKMIEYLTTPAQIQLIKKALANHVVTLIQDLNGNHVIQRCLNRLSSVDNQFIYDSVSQAGHCVEVATHRHGCCVLQRCVDHASEHQKIQLINEIIANALVLVQDPYGNYVVQYVLDLPFRGLASDLARRFLGHIPILSTQKFSSNVIEKCLNVADVPTRALVIQEVIEYDNLLYLLQDPYANYVVQTSLNVSEPAQHARLVEAIRPHLPSLRNTPYGKRIQNKIMKESSRDYYA